jgi:hypothetical protein
LSHMHVPKQFWSDAVLTACYLINRMPSSVLDGVSPRSLLYPSSSPFSLPLKVFGCVCYVHNLGPGFDKLDPRATKCVFLGYSSTQKGYRCYSPVLRRYFTSADVTLLSLSPISLLQLLWVTLFLHLMLRPFRCLFHFSLSLPLLLRSCRHHTRLPHSRFIRVDHAH